MFHSQAHSFARQAHLAILLAWVAGYSNVLSLLTCGIPISHMSGMTTNFGHHLADAEWASAQLTGFILASFLLGALVSGACAEIGRRRHWHSIYVLPVAIEAALLAVYATLAETLVSDTRPTGGLLFALVGLDALAMGLQNATITRISSGVVRTTHVTGVVTDFGLEAAQACFRVADRWRGRTPIPSTTPGGSPARLVLLLAIFGSFAIGAGLGSVAYHHLDRGSMLPPVAFLLWIVTREVFRPTAALETSSMMHADSGWSLPPELVVYHLRTHGEKPGGKRSSRAARMPNFLEWIERLPGPARIVVLDLSGVRALDENTVLELGAALKRLLGRNQELVVAGVTPEHFVQLKRWGPRELIDPRRICSDFELGVAVGLSQIDPSPTVAARS